MTLDSLSSTQINPPWQGFHHLALVTPNLDSTLQFYREVLGMEVLFVGPAGEMHGRSAGVLPGQGVLGLLHFFEMPNAEIFAPPDLKTMYWLPGALHHIAFTLPNETAAEALRTRLTEHGVTMSEIMDQGDVRNMVFQDNHGLLLEATWTKETPTA